MLILSQALAVGSSLLIARSLGPIGRGSLTTLFVWSQLLGWVASLSLDKGIIVLSRQLPAQEFHPDSGLASARRVTIVSSLPLVGLSLFLGLHFFGNWTWAVLLGLGTLATTQYELIAGWFLATDRSADFILFRLSQPALYLLACAVALLTCRHAAYDTRLNVLAILTTVALVLPVVVGFVVTRITTTTRVRLRQLLRFALATQAANAMQYLNSRLDVLALSILSTHREVGLYAVGVAVGQSTVALGSAGIIRGITGKADRIDLIGVLATSALGLVVASASPVLIPLIFGQSFVPSIRIAQIIALGGAANYALQSSSGRLLGLGDPFGMAFAEFAGVVAFAAGIAVSHELEIVAMASVLSYAVSFVVAQVILHTSHTRPSHRI